jgi:hypothetical protein
MSGKLRGFLQMTAVAVAAAGVFWLLQNHWRHASGFLVYAPFLLFLACPLMHVFMHHGHGNDHTASMPDHPEGPASRSGA